MNNQGRTPKRGTQHRPAGAALNRKRRKNNRTMTIVISVITVLLIAAIATVLILALRGQGSDPADTGAANTAAKVTGEVPTGSSAEPEDVFAHAANIKISKVEGESAPQYVNPLTGEALNSDIAGMRPAAIMINNIQASCPQIGVSKADILYECLAEGGITRLVMLSQDYGALETVGSVRSSRKYFIDFALNHDALYIHAGGSEEAYSEILNRGIDHLDGVRTDAATGINLTGSCYYRDQQRMKTMAYEHSLMTTGEMIKSGIATMGYRTTLKEGFKNPMNIIKSGYRVDLDGSDGTYVKITYRDNDYPEYEYDAATGKYLRWQYKHQEHIDGATGEQLSFTNVLILVMKHTNTNDDKNHINVETVGTGSGYYFTGGKMIPINWSRADDDEPMVMTDSEGNVLLLNKGKTAINVISPEVESTLVIGAH